jgi:opacity protein-like surface antigen
MRHQITLALAAAIAGWLCSTSAAAAPVVWSGVYVGVNGGGDWRSADIGSSTEVLANASGFLVPQRGIIIVPGTTFPVPGASSTGAGGDWGGQLGMNFQSGPWVFGVEGDGGSGSGKVSTSFSAPLPATALTPGIPLDTLTSSSAVVRFSTMRQLSWSAEWSVRARVGYAWDRFLVYGTAGVAGAEGTVNFTDTWSDLPGGFAAPNAIVGSPPACQFGPNYNPAACPGTANLGPLGPVVATGSRSQMQIGWTAGVGGEAAVSSAVSLGLEYRHTDLGSKTYAPVNPTVTDSGPAIPPGTINGQANAGATPVSLSDDRVTVRLNWRFWRLER